ncbi:MAG: DUF6155 family protein [Bacteroidales bacterium]|jgi:hypothetical protein|nr:DUF6155 family protein [Bacteroidales bacterium]
MGLREVKNELNKLDKADLIKHISELYKKYKPVKEYFDFYINPDEKKLLEQYKEKVTEGFFPKRGYQLKLSISRKAINDFKKLGTSAESLADLLLHFVENGVEFTNEYGDIDENFYTSVENTYSSALDLIDNNGLLDKFKKRAYEIVTDTDGIGWGFHDSLGDLYYHHYE